MKTEWVLVTFRNATKIVKAGRRFREEDTGMVWHGTIKSDAQIVGNKCSWLARGDDGREIDCFFTHGYEHYSGAVYVRIDIDETGVTDEIAISAPIRAREMATA